MDYIAHAERWLALTLLFGLIWNAIGEPVYLLLMALGTLVAGYSAAKGLYEDFIKGTVINFDSSGDDV